jgi:dipeptidyl aminopeptidase/acylaminoacyl peptidase
MSKRTAIILTLSAALAAGASSPTGLAAEAGAPPLIDREVFFGDPQISGAQISPDGSWVSFRQPYREVMNIWVKKADEPFDAARPMTADSERPVTGYFWSEDSRYLLYVQDKGGDENYHVYAVDPKAKPDQASGVPPARNLTPYDGVRAMIYAVPESAPGHIIVGLNDRNPALHDVYRVEIASGKRELLITNESNVAAWVTDRDGTVRLAWRQTDDGGSEILRVVDGALGGAIYSCTFEETCVPIRFHVDGDKVYLQSNRGEDVDLIRLMLMNVKTGEATLIETDPEGEVDFGGAIFSDVTEKLIGTYYVGDRVRIYPRDEALARDLERIRAQVPDGEIALQSMTEDMSTMLISVSRDVDPGSVYVYRREPGTVEKLYTSRPDLPTEHLAPMKAVRYTARDGQQIPAYLTIPKGAGSGGLPAIVLPHGGPWARDNWGYDALAQFLANRGYVVLQPNFRGSTGYGKAFLNAGNGEWGTGTMQHDLSDAVRFLVDSKIADPKKIAIMGGSYGGYATLAGLAFTPQLYAAGVSIVGPSNIITLLDSIPPYWGPIRKLFTVRVGDPDVPEERARLEAQSPLNSATAIDDPLLVIQGANDPRVKQAESDQIVVALRDLERTVEYVVAPDEGHGFAGRENRLAMFAIIEEFLAEHLGGRFQEGASPEVSARIAAITVDPATVEMPVRAAGLDAARTSALPALDPQRVQELELQYAVRLAMSGQELDIENSVSVAPVTEGANDAWAVASRVSGAMGEGGDRWIVDRSTLLPIGYSAAQGPVAIEIAYGDARITGAITMGPQEMAIDAGLDAPVWASENGLRATLAALPLAEGFETTFRTFDVQTQKIRVWSLRVVGAETVEVPAGSFDCLKLAIEPLDDLGGGQTLWISAVEPFVTVRVETKLPPQAGGGDMTTTLTSLETK